MFLLLYVELIIVFIVVIFVSKYFKLLKTILRDTDAPKLEVSLYLASFSDIRKWNCIWPKNVTNVQFKFVSLKSPLLSYAIRHCRTQSTM